MFSVKALTVVFALISFSVYAAPKDYENGRALQKGAAEVEGDKQAQAQMREIVDQYNAASDSDKKRLRENAKKGIKESVSKMIPARISPDVALIKFVVDNDSLIYTYQIDLDKKDLEKQVSLRDFGSQQRSTVMPSVCGGSAKVLLDVDLNVTYVYVDKKLNKLTDMTFTKQTCGVQSLRK